MYRAEIDTALAGKLTVFAHEHSVFALCFPHDNAEAVLSRYRKLSGDESEIVHSCELLAQTADYLERYFHGEPVPAHIPVDLLLTRAPFYAAAQRTLADIPYGQTVTYRELATATGSANAVRAVGTACAHNPVPIILPCHRVTRTDGKPGAYRGGTELKKKLLTLEGSL